MSNDALRRMIENFFKLQALDQELTLMRIGCYVAGSSSLGADFYRLRDFPSKSELKSLNVFRGDVEQFARSSVVVALAEFFYETESVVVQCARKSMWGKPSFVFPKIEIKFNLDHIDQVVKNKIKTIYGASYLLHSDDCVSVDCSDIDVPGLLFSANTEDEFDWDEDHEQMCEQLAAELKKHL